MNSVTEAHGDLSASELQTLLDSGPIDAIAWRKLLNQIRESHSTAFRQGTSASELIRQFTAVVDQMLRSAWQSLIPADAGAALLAVGGFGRGELLPRSDIDLLILYREGELDDLQDLLGRFITFVWDMGLEVGHSVRSPRECAEEAAADVTVVTNLMESRLLSGDAELMEAMQVATGTDRVWPDDAFFKAKREEQIERYKRYDDTAYKLEPNVKESPGGLRDIQIIGWVTQRHYGTAGLEELHARGLLKANEMNYLISGRAFLWQVRFALHMLTGRPEDRLLFDQQIKVAELFGYQDKTHNLAVEQFMQMYYRTIKGLSALNDIFLQLMDEEIFHRQAKSQPQALNEDFHLRHGFIEAREEGLFTRKPMALLEIFHTWATHEHLRIKGISAATLREMRRDRNLLESVRESLEAREMFLRLLRMERGVLHSLRRMNRYGILGRYLPAFGKIIGRMQYDLFHTLTVDEHTLFVVRNMRRLAVPEFRHEFPQLSDLHASLKKPELLYIAGLFHDIAKGREGDHSELGAEDVRAFCASHGLSSQDGEMAAWLVSNHLLMSMTAQRKDVSDPDVINEFIQAADSREKLDYLYLLTVCDIRATNAKLWNDFRASLLRSLYVSARRALDRGDPVGTNELICETRLAALTFCQENGLTDDVIENIWDRLDDDYFLRHAPEEVSWHTQAIANAPPDRPTVLVRHFSNRGTAVFIYMQDAPRLFAITSTCLAKLGLSILDARINCSADNYTLDTFIVSEADGREITDPVRRKEIGAKLLQNLSHPEAPITQVRQHVSQQRRHFSTPTQIYFTPEPDKGHTTLELVADDRPGLLALIAHTFDEMGVELRAAKIGTIGERAEDVFFITDGRNQAIEDPARLHDLREKITSKLQQLD